MADVDTATSSEVDVPQQTSVDANQSQGQLEIAVEEEEPSSSVRLAIETPVDTGEQSFSRKKLLNSLYQAALRSDWESALLVFELYKDVNVVIIPISQQNMNVLQVAIASTAKYTTFVKELLIRMRPEELEFTNNNGDTVLAITALSGNVKIAREIVNKNGQLPMIRNKKGNLPLLIAAMHNHRDMLLYLYSVTTFDELTRAERIKLLLCTISWDMYDKAKEILENDLTLATAEDENKCTALQEFAKKPFAIASRSLMSAWERFIGFAEETVMTADGLTLVKIPFASWNQMSAWERFKVFCLERIYHKALMQVLAYQLVEALWKEVKDLELEQREKYSSTIFLAAELGNVEFLTILIHSDPELIWMNDEKQRNIFHISIIYRQESIFNLIHHIGIFKDMMAANCDIDKNNMLHLAGKLASANRLNIISGAALQMQRELLWFKEVEKIVPFAFSNEENSEHQTPNDLFIKTHEDLRKGGEEWMRNTSTNCMLVATLIATMVFAAAFTVPGGNDQVKGSPIFLERNWFTIFFVSDSIALLCSTSSVLIFLSILTSRYTEHDFLYSLPKRLVLGLAMLFISIVAMVIAFNATCFLVYQNKTAVIPSVTILLACIPILCFIMLHCRLFFDIARSTLWSRYLFQSGRHKLF